MKQNNKSKFTVGSKGYLILMSFFIIMSIFIFAMTFALSSTPGNKDTISGFLITQSIWPIAALLMLYKQIQYMRKSKIPFRPFSIIPRMILWLRQFLNPWKYKYHPAHPDTTEFGKMISRFRNDYINFYSSNTLDTNITQFFQHLLFLHKKRLKKSNLVLHYELNRMKLEGKPSIRHQIIRDGKFRHIHAQEYVKGNQYFVKGSKKIYSQKIDGCADYDVIGVPDHGAEKEGLSFLCPGCGAVSTAHELLSGCPYCGKKFMIEELSDRVCNMSFYSDPELDFMHTKNTINKYVNCFAFAFTLLEILGFYSMFHEVFIEKGASLRELPFAIVITVFSLILILGLCLFVNNLLAVPFRIIIYKIYKKVKKGKEKELQIISHNQAFAKKIQHFDPGFSLNSFFSNVRNKLAVIHYADSQKQMTGFTTTNLAQYISQYKNVVNCIFQTPTITNYHLSGNRQIIKLTVPMQLLILEGDYLKKVPETVDLELEKHRFCSSSNPYGILVPVCPDCGAPVDILSGNCCTYCGNLLNLLDFDWCIKSYIIK